MKCLSLIFTNLVASNSLDALGLTHTSTKINDSIITKNKKHLDKVREKYKRVKIQSESESESESEYQGPQDFSARNSRVVLLTNPYIQPSMWIQHNQHPATTLSLNSKHSISLVPQYILHPHRAIHIGKRLHIHILTSVLSCAHVTC